MKLLLNAIRVNPNMIEEIKIEDVASFSVDDTKIRIIYNKLGENGEQSEIIFLRANDGKNIHEWSGFSIFGTRIGLKIDMNK